MLVERAVEQASLIEKKILKWFAIKDWNYLLSNLDDTYENMVKEFNANAIVEGEELKCWVRGKKFLSKTGLSGRDPTHQLANV